MCRCGPCVFTVTWPFKSLLHVKDSLWILKQTLTIFEKAIQLSEDLYIGLIKLLVDVGISEDVERVSALGTSQYPSSATLAGQAVGSV